MSKDTKETPKTGGEVIEDKDLKTTEGSKTPDVADILKGEEIIEKSSKSTKSKEDTKAETKKVDTKKTDSKKVEEVKEEEVVKDPVLDFEIDPNKTYEFRLKEASYRYIVPSVATVLDETDGNPREIRLTNTSNSPFVEDQPENTKPSSNTLSFIDGKLILQGTQAPAIRYLLAYDGFAGKKQILPSSTTVKGLYTLFIPEEEEKKKLELEEAKLEAKLAIKKASDQEVADFITGIKNSILSGDSARLEALRYAESNPKIVMDGLTNPVFKTKAQLIKASFKGLIAVANGQIVGPTGKVLFTTTATDVLLDAAKEVASATAKGNALLDVIAQV